MNYYTTAETPLGELAIVEEEGSITRLFLSKEDLMQWKESVENTEQLETAFWQKRKSSFTNILREKERYSHCH